MDAVRDDPGQSTDTHDVLAAAVGRDRGRTLDLGCGEGQGMRLVGRLRGRRRLSLGCSSWPAHTGRSCGPGFRTCHGCDPPSSTASSRSGSLDLIEDHETFFTETARVVRARGHLMVVINHPVATSPESASLVDPDGEILWRWGYLSAPGDTPPGRRAATSSNCSTDRSAPC